ncbi:MAG: radical SAM protein [candidate division WOR-3 bacterium]|nr:radical SAM protein [candidate division WOR-3 bacterium]
MNRVWNKAITLSRLISSVRKRRVLSLPIYITNRCTSRCRTCNIWRIKEKEDIDKDVIEDLLCDNEIRDSVEFIITGGDFLLHPECREIVSLFKGKNLRLFSNGILADKLVSLVREEGVRYVSVSLDGRPETNKYIRGVDTYKNVERIVKELKDFTHIEIEYTISKWNTKEDLRFVMDFVKKYEIDLSVGYYSRVGYFGAEEDTTGLYSVSDLIASDYHSLYPLWANGKLNLPCYSIFVRPVIKSNGDVELCEARQVKLGNLYKRSFGEIWRDEKTAKIIRSFFKCNGCWLNCQRKSDLGLTYIPRRLGLYFHKDIKKE